MYLFIQVDMYVLLVKKKSRPHSNLKSQSLCPLCTMEIILNISLASCSNLVIFEVNSLKNEK